MVSVPPPLDERSAHRLWFATSGDTFVRGARRHRVAVAIGRRELLASASKTRVRKLLGPPDHIGYVDGHVSYGYRVGVYRRQQGGCTEVLELDFEAGRVLRPRVDTLCTDMDVDA